MDKMQRQIRGSGENLPRLSLEDTETPGKQASAHDEGTSEQELVEGKSKQRPP